MALILADLRYIDWKEYGELVSLLAKRIKSGSHEFDLVVGIARGGIPVAMVISDQLGVKIDIINVKSYTGIAKRSEVRIVSTLTEDVRGKSVLIVDDLIDEGETIKTVIEYLAKEEPKRMMTAVLFKKPWSKFEPDFYLEVVDKWIVFPWELGEVERIMKSLAKTTAKDSE